MDSIGRRISSRRKNQRLSQEELAQVINTSQKQISRYETDENIPSSEVLRLIAIALDTTTDYIIGLSDSPERPIREPDLNKDEIELINTFRMVPKIDRQKILEILKVAIRGREF